MKIWMCGLPGSGKSTLGKVLALLTGAPFYESDAFQSEEDHAAIKAKTFGSAERHALLRRIMRSVDSDGHDCAIIAQTLPTRASRQLVANAYPGGTALIYVEVPPALARSRLARGDRADHPFRPEMLDQEWLSRCWESPDGEGLLTINNAVSEYGVLGQLRSAYESILERV